MHLDLRLGPMGISHYNLKTIISGQRQGLIVAVMRLLLRPLAVIYSLAIRTRNTLYDRHLLPAHRIDAKVISVGNITTGGTGKTPLVAYLCHYLTSQIPNPFRPEQIAILTRGYKTRIGGLGPADEPMLLAKAAPGVRVIVNPDRLTGAICARSLSARIMILDDGFQHRRLARDLDVVALDATCPFGFGQILPAGLLREPISSINRADAVVITRADQVNKQDLVDIEAVLRGINQQIVIAHAIHRPLHIHTAEGKTMPVSQLEGKRIYTFCGIGNPDGFFCTIKSLGGILVGKTVFNDHHTFTKQDLLDVYRQAESASADMILTATKNWLGLDPAWLRKDVAYLQIDLVITRGQQELLKLVQDVLGRS